MKYGAYILIMSESPGLINYTPSFQCYNNSITVRGNVIYMNHW